MKFDWCETNLNIGCGEHKYDHCEMCNIARAYQHGYKIAKEDAPSADAVPLRSDCAECALRAINRPKLDEESYEKGYTAGQFADRPKGKWEYCEHAGISDVWKCNQCGEWMFGKTNFCPFCGADMRGEEE